MKSLTQLIAGLNIVEPLKGYPFLDFSALYQCSIIELLFAFKKMIVTATHGRSLLFQLFKNCLRVTICKLRIGQGLPTKCLRVAIELPTDCLQSAYELRNTINKLISGLFTKNFFVQILDSKTTSPRLH